MLKICFYNIGWLLILSLQVSAQQPIFKSFSHKEGLNTYGINKTLQDKYGFIWIATQDGLYRFNGKSFEVIKNNTERKKATAGNFFFDITLASDGEIYAADFNKGIDIINPLNLDIENIQIKSGHFSNTQLPHLWLKKLYVDRLNNLWIGAKDFIAFKKNNQLTYTTMDKLPDFNGSLNVLFIKPVSADYIAVSISGYGILLFNINTLQPQNTIKNLRLKPIINNLDVKDMFMVKDTVFAITDNEIIKGKFTGSQWQWLAEYPIPKHGSLIVNCMVKNGPHDFWIGTNLGLLNLNTSSGKFVHYKAGVSKKRWLQDNSINHLMIDAESNLWISTSKALQMISLVSNGFRYFSGDDDKSIHMDHIYSLVQKNKTEIFATATDGLYLTNLVTGKVAKIPGSSSIGLVHYLQKITDDFWMVCSDLGMYGYIPSASVLSRESLIKRYPEWEKYKYRYFNNSCSVGSISYLASEEEEGLFKWDIEKHRIVQFKSGTPNSGGVKENHIHNIKMDREGYLWLLTDNTLEKFDAKKDSVTDIIKDVRQQANSLASIFFDMYDDGKQYWFGSYGGGLNVYNKEKKSWIQITEKDGLCNNSVYGILPEFDSVLWVSTNMGLSRLNYYTRTCYNYYYEDGLQDNSFDEKGYLQIGRKLYFGGINGFTEIDPDKLNLGSTIFPVYVYKLEYYGNSKKQTLYNLAWNKLYFPSQTTTITIHLAALSFSNNHKIKFSYKIEGRQNDFIEVGENNIITLNALSYGSYNILVRYRKNDGSFVENAMNLQLFILPKWYQTWWWKIGVFLTTAGIIYAFYRYRITQIKKQHEIRKNIATDLHDDLGSTLTSVKVFTNLAIRGVNQQESLQHIKHNLNEATTGLRDMIWVLDDSLDTMDELLTRLKLYAIPVAGASNMEFTTKAPSEIRHRRLTKEEKRNLFLICKEAINNSIKYSGATDIAIEITASGKKIQLVVTDNGRGFNAAEVIKGYGLKNMQYRAAQIKYDVNLVSSRGKGTQIIIRQL